jgi:Rieske 2Fe-2S family protein
MERAKTFLTSTLPGRYYYDPEIYALEQQRIFSHMWICVGHIGALPDPGMYQTTIVGGENILVVRGQDRKLRAFLNVCRHRGTRLCAEATGKLKGSVQCRYHAWTYGLDGQLIGTPNVSRDEQLERTAFSLIPVALELWEGLIWLNLAEDPPPLAKQLEEGLPAGPDFAPFLRCGLGQLKPGKTIAYKMRINWKVFVENNLECYHCRPVHPELCNTILPPIPHEENAGLRKSVKLADGVEAYTITGKASRPPLPGLLPEERRDFYGVIMVPNVLLTVIYDRVSLQTFHPQGPDATLINSTWLFDPVAVASPDFDPMDTVALDDFFIQQDKEVCELVQLAMRSRAYQSGGVYTANEIHLGSFRDFILNKLEREIE